MGKFNFKSSGLNIIDIKSKKDSISEISKPIEKIGIKTPLELGTSDVFKMHTNLHDQIADNLKNLILTNHGERLGLYNFGANLKELLTEYNSEIQNDFEQIVQNRIIDAVSTWMPFVKINIVSILPEKNTINGMAVVVIKLDYVVFGLDNTQKRELKVKLFVI